MNGIDPMSISTASSMPLFNHFYAPVSILYTAECRVAMTPREVSSCLVGYKTWPFSSDDGVNDIGYNKYQTKINRIPYQEKQYLVPQTLNVGETKMYSIPNCFRFLPSDCWCSH